MGELDKALVSIGIKGQDVVLSTLDRVQKKIKSLTSDIERISLRTQSGGSKKSKLSSEGMESGSTDYLKYMSMTGKSFKDVNKDLTDSDKKLKKFTKDVESGSKEQKKASKSGKESNKSLEKAKEGISNVSHGMASLSPSALIHSLASIPGLIPHAGIAGKAIGGAAGLSVVAGTGAMEIAKNAVAHASELYQRNATTANYGGNKITQGNMSNNEKAYFVSTISGSMGKLQNPMIDALNKLSGHKDTGALANVAAGNWRSTGTDKGFFLQKLADSFGDLPPSIAQRFQSKLLTNYGEEIQESTAEQRKAQGRNAGFEISNENKDLAINKVLDEAHKTNYKNPKTGKIETETTSIYESTLKSYEDMNKAMIDMIRMGTEFTGFLSDASKAVSTLSTAAAHGAAKIRSMFYSTK